MTAEHEHEGDCCRFCGTMEPRAGAEEYRWRKTHLRICVSSDLPGMLRQAFLTAVMEAARRWQAVCGLTFESTNDQRGCDILVTTGPIDGASGTLAWSELPPGDDRMLKQKYDTAEKWRTAAGSGIDLVAVVCHELGHAIGLPHAAQSAPDLMAPYYKPEVSSPGAGDIARIQKLYGPPVVPPPPPPPPPSGGSKIVIEVYNADAIKIPGYRVVRE